MPRIILKHHDVFLPFFRKLEETNSIMMQVQHLDRTNAKVVKMTEVFRQVEPLRTEGLRIHTNSFFIRRQLNMESLLRRHSDMVRRARVLEERLVYVFLELDNLINAMKELAESIVPSMETTQVTQTHLDEKKDSCCICLDDYHVDETVKKCPKCQNIIHSHCIEAWFREDTTCPHCRQVLNQ